MAGPFDDLIPSSSKPKASINPFQDLIPEPEPGVADIASASVKRKAGQAGIAAGNILDDAGIKTGIGDAGRDVVANNMPAVSSLEDIAESPIDAAVQAASETPVDMAINLGGRAIGAGIGGFIGRRIGMGAQGAKHGEEVGGWLTSSAQSYGGIREEQKAEGIDSIPRALLAAGASGLVETAVGPEHLISKYVKGGGKLAPGASRATNAVAEAGKAALGEGATNAVAEAGKAALGEGATEYVQSQIEQVGAGQDPFTAEGQKQAAFEGVMGAGGGGVIGGVVGAVAPREAVRPPQNTEEMMAQLATGQIPNVKIDSLIPAAPGAAQNETATAGPLERVVNQNQEIIDAASQAVEAQRAEAAAAGAVAAGNVEGEQGQAEAGVSQGVGGQPGQAGAQIPPVQSVGANLSAQPAQPAQPEALPFTPDPSRGPLSRAVATAVETGALAGPKSDVIAIPGQGQPAQQPLIIPGQQSQPAAQQIQVAEQPRFSNAAATIDVDGEQLPSTNSRGKPIAPDEESTRNFWRSMKGTKVVDEQGRPIEVYHGTTSDFSTFRQSEKDIGMHFGTAEQAKARASGDWKGANIMPVYLDIKNPIRLADPKTWTAPKLRKQLLSKFKSDSDKAEINGLKTPQDVRDFLISKGYDGAVYKNNWEMDEPSPEVTARYEASLAFQPGGVLPPRGTPEREEVDAAREQYFAARSQDSYIAFKPEQIKSATANVGTFDTNNPDIRFSSRASISDRRGTELSVSGGPVDEVMAGTLGASARGKPGADTAAAPTKSGKGWNDRPVQPDAVSMAGVHYTNTAGLKALDGRYYGTNHKGAESVRLSGLKGEKGKLLRNRIGFYPEGSDLAATGESMVGRAEVHRVQLDNLYDIDADPRGLKAKVDKPGMSDDDFFNALDMAIINEGFDGIYVPKSRMIYLLGTKPVPVGARASQKPEIKERGTEASRPRNAMRADVIRRLADPITKSWSVKVNIVDTPEQFPDAVKAAPGFSPDLSEAVIFGDEIYIAASQVGTVKDLYRLLAHEGVAHAGVEKMAGKQWPQLVKEINKLLDKGGWLAKEVAARYPKADADTRAAEAIALMAERGVRSGIMSRLVAAARKFARDLGFNVQFTDRDLRDMIAAAARQMNSGKASTKIRMSNHDQTKAEAFKRWFGDSKVIDADGKPLVVYHGSPQGGFDEFDVSNVGAFFSSRYDIAASYAGAFDDVELPAPGAEFYDENKGVYSTYLKIENPLTIDWGGNDWGDGPEGLRLDEWANRAKRAGHDGLIVENVVDTGWLNPSAVTDKGDGTVYVAFRPEQIKSATHNNGTFDPLNPDIRFSNQVEPGYEVEELDFLDFADVAGLSGGEQTSAALVAKAQEAWRELGTDSPFFRDWFGKSKFKKADGTPVPLYHATSTDFESFDPNRAGESTGYAASGLGIFMTPKRSAAERYGDKVLKLYARIEKPYIMSPEESGSFDSVAEARKRREQLMAAGYDGIFIKEDGTTIAFQPQQVKAADNRGTFDLDDVRMRFSNRVGPVVNIGLDVNDGSKLTKDEAIAALQSTGARVLHHRLKQSNTEQTLIAKLDRGLTPEEAFKVSADLRQDAIAQLAGRKTGLFGPEAAKWGDFNKGYFLRFSNKAQTETPEFKKWSKGAKVVMLGDKHDFKAGEPVVVHALHGTTADFSVFDPAKSNPESDLGAGLYFTNTPGDVAKNYAGQGPDLTSKMELEAERLASNEDLDGDEAIRIVREKYMANLGTTMPVFVRFDNPAVIGGKNETFLDYEGGYDDETEEYTGSESGTMIPFVQSIRRDAGEYNFDEDYVLGPVVDAMMEGGGVGAGRLIDLLKANAALSDAADENGALVNNEVIRRAFEAAGFDGFIDATVDKKFGSQRRRGQIMAGMNPNTVHFIAFDGKQVKSAIGNNGQFDPLNPDIRFSNRKRETLDPEIVQTLGKHIRNLLPAERAKLRRDTAERLVNQIQSLPSASEMAAVAYAGRAKRGWYWNSARAIEHVFGGDAPRFAGLLAALSPQCSVETNLLNTLNTWKNWVAAGRPTDRETIIDIMGKSVQGGRGRASVLDAWINNTVRALSAEDPSTIVLSGPKVNSFMLNLRGVVDEVTNDAWMANYALVNQAIFGGSLTKGGDPGKSSGYLAMSAQVRAAAKKLTQLTGEEWTPAEVQETIWSWAKTLYESASVKKSAEEIVADRAVTDEMINSTPDFRTLFHDEVNEKILTDAGLGGRVASLRRREDLGGAVGETAGAQGQAAPFAPEAQLRHEARAAKRLDELRVREYPEDARFSNREVGALAAYRAGRDVTLYHGTANPDLLLSRGKVGRGTAGANRGRTDLLYVTTDPENARWFADEAGGGHVVEVSVPAKQLVIDPEDGTADTVEEQLESSVRIGIPASLAVSGDLPASAFRRTRFSNKPVFYSALLRAVESGTMPKKAGPAAYKQWLDGAQRRGEFKQSERDWLGVDAWLSDQKEVTRDQLVEFVRANQVDVQEDVLGQRNEADRDRLVGARVDAERAWSDSRNAFPRDPERTQQLLEAAEAANAAVAEYDRQFNGKTKFDQYTLPGGQNYRELLLTLPVKTTLPDGFSLKQIEAGPRKGQWAVIGPGPLSENRYGTGATQAEAIAAFGAHGHNGPTYKSSHFDQPNILAHVRFNERTDADGKRVLFVEEVQSDWHQEGRKKGYAKTYYRTYNTKSGNQGPSFDTKTQADEYIAGLPESMRGSVLVREEKDASGTVPDAPLKKEWPLTAMKRMIRYAADNGFDRISWTTGDQQAERYDLSKQVDAISWVRRKDGTYDIAAFLKHGDRVINKDRLSPSEVADMIGKDLAERITKEKGEPLPLDWADATGTLKGIDLKVGGDGMRAFYDKMLPNELGKYVKKWGGKVGETKLPKFTGSKSASSMSDSELLGALAEPDGGNKVHAVDITPAMRDAAMQGQPLFSNKPTLRERFEDALYTTKTFNWWHNSVGTQYHKAQVDADFRAVYEKGQDFLNDVSRIAMESADHAPSLLPKLESLRDVLKRGPSAKDLEAVSDAVFTGTLEDETVYTDDELRDRFNLSDKQIGYYREFRASIDASLDELNASEIVRITRDMIPQVAGRIRSNPADAARIAIDALGNVGTPAALGQIKVVFERQVKIDELKMKGYAPLMRFGRYTVYVTDGAEQVYFGTFENEADATRVKREMQDAYPQATVRQGVMSQEAWKQFKGISPDTLELFAEGAGLSYGQAFQEYLRLAKNNRSAMKRLIRRKGVAGFERDASRVLASFITSNARAASTNYHFADMQRAAAAIDKEKGDVKDEAVRLAEYIQNPQEEAGALRGFLFTQFIGGSLASAVTNMTQPVMMTFPWLSQFAGTGAAAKHLASAGAVAAGQTPNDPDLRSALERATKDGVVAPHEIHQLYAESMRNFGSNPMIRKGLKVWGSFFSLAESFNRRISFVAAYNAAKEMGDEAVAMAGFRDAYDFAVNAVEATQGVYNRGNRPNWARGAIGATVFTFKQYSISYLEFLKRLPAKERALALGILVLASGLQGLPGADDLEDLIDTIGQSLGYNTNSKKAMRESLLNALGEDFGSFVAHGSSSFTPIDVQARMGLGNLIPGTSALKRSTTDRGRDALEAIGPVGGLIKQAMDSFSRVQAGDLSGAATSLAPLAVQNAAKGVTMATTGQYNDTQGRKVVDTTIGDAVAKGIGFQPANVADVQRTIGGEQQDINMVRNVQSDIADAWAQALAAGDPAGVRAAVARMRDWNSKNPTTPIVIDRRQLIARVKAIKSTKAERTLKATPGQLKGGVAQALGQ